MAEQSFHRRKVLGSSPSVGIRGCYGVLYNAEGGNRARKGGASSFMGAWRKGSRRGLKIRCLRDVRVRIPPLLLKRGAVGS